jgi:hypothetical protein
MKHISLETHDDAVKQFVLALPPESAGVVLELNGQPIVRMTPVPKSYDAEKLKAAILARREESRAINREWHDVDSEVCERSAHEEG